MPDEFEDTFDAPDAPAEQPAGDALDDPPPMPSPTKDAEPATVTLETESKTYVFDATVEQVTIVDDSKPYVIPLKAWIVRHLTFGKATVMACDSEGAKDAFCAAKGQPRAKVEEVYELTVSPFVTAATEV